VSDQPVASDQGRLADADGAWAKSSAGPRDAEKSYGNGNVGYAT